MKICTILGARPQFIKAATVSRLFYNSGFVNEVIIHTGQHFDANMSDVFFKEMTIPSPAYNLNINGLGHGAMTGKMLASIEEILIKEKPDYVIVYGDTNSTLAGALAAQKLQIPIVHVEAGLRSFNMSMPEEVNRILTDRISSLLFCPTSTAICNLQKEGFDNFNCKIWQSGDVMQDAAIFYANQLGSDEDYLKSLGLGSRNYVLATIHRQENTDDPVILSKIFSSLETINQNITVILPIHPRTHNRLKQLNIFSSLHFIDPVGYFDMIRLIRNSAFVMTDSGGLQKEAYFFNKFCITLREQTEWVELVDNGFNRICGSDQVKIDDAFKYFTSKSFTSGINLYGDGNAAQFIVDKILEQQ